MKKIAFIISLFLLTQTLLLAQEFGQNKIQYKNFDWKSIKTPHFIIYYYQGEEDLVKFAAQVAEDSYIELKEDMSHNFKKRIPIIIYNSHNDFEQTNVTLSLVEESVGGFTEIFKSRMVFPFDGSYESFRHVINHELVHAFQFDILFSSKLGSVMQSELMLSLPLWVMEGLAEFESLNWNSETENYIRDAVINNRLLSIQELNYSYGYAVYKEGQSIYKFISDTYGRKKIGEFFHTLRQTKDFEKALKRTIGLSVEQLNKEWTKSLKKKYWPSYDKKTEISTVARKLTDHKKQGNAYNVSPSISPDGTKIAYITDKEEYIEIYILSSISGKILKKLVKGTKSQTFESLHFLRPGISWSTDGKSVAFSAKAGKEDVIYIMDAENAKVRNVLRPRCDAVYSPNFSPDDKTLVFCGIKDGMSDIYSIEIATQKLTRLTEDTSDDRDPVYSPQGDLIVFSSDRQDSTDSLWHYGEYALFSMRTNGSNIEQLTERESHLGNPTFGENGKKIIFTSDRAGVNNLYVLEIDSLNIKRLTDVFGNISSPTLSSNGKKLAFCGYQNSGYDIYVMHDPFEYAKTQPSERIDYHGRHSVVNNDYFLGEEKKAGLNFSTDWAGGYLVYSSGYGFQSMLEIAISDVLGDNRFDLAFDLYSRNLLDSNFQIVYWFLPKRWDIGAAIFQQKNYYLVFPTTQDNRYQYIEETLRGGSTLLRLPIDKFHRFDIGMDLFTVQQFYEWIDQYNNMGEGQTELYFVAVPSINWIRDTALWGYTGPVNGERWEFSYAKSIPQISKNSFDYSIVFGDIRNYFRIKRDYSFATRIFGFSSYGKDALSYSLGGSENIRGFDYYSFYGTKAGFMNFEIRYPFIDKLEMRFPLPLSIRGVRGVTFCDIGGVTDKLKDFKTAIGENGKFRLDDLKLGFGTGIRMNITIAVLKFDAAWHTDLDSVSRMHLHFSLGSEF